MLADVGMVKTYSKSVHVNDLGFAWTGPEKGIGAFFTAARTHVEVRLALYTVQPPFLVSGFLCWFLLLFRSSATFRLYYSIQTTTTIPT